MPAKKGRGEISDYQKRTSSFSKRAGHKLTLSVQRKSCPFCHHHKLLVSSEHRKCARCKRWLPISDKDLELMRL